MEITGEIHKSSTLTGAIVRSTTLTGQIYGIPASGGIPGDYLFPTGIWDNTLTWLNSKYWKNNP